jgi:hypothetical protein
LSKKETSPQPAQPAGPRLSKREQLRVQRRRRSMAWNIGLLGIGVVMLGLIAVYFFNIARPGPLPGEQAIVDAGGGHVDTSVALTYQHYPPSSGQHYDATAPWGVYTDATQPVPEGNFLHNLEHGGVVFVYYCAEACPDLEQQFVDLYDSAPLSKYGNKKMVVTTYDPSKMGGFPIVALAWGHQLNLQAFDENTMLTWYRRFVDYGPEDVP